MAEERHDAAITNGSRYVTHARLADVMDRHREISTHDREALAERLARMIDTRARREDLERVSGEVATLSSVVAGHDDLIQQLRGARTLLVAVLGTNVLAVVLMLASIWSVLR